MNSSDSSLPSCCGDRSGGAAGAQTAQAPQQPAGAPAAPAQPARANRPPPPTRDPNTPGYVRRRQLPDGADSTRRCVRELHHRPDLHAGARDDGRSGVLEGTVHTFTMESTDSKIYPGIRREQGTFGTPDPNNPAKLDVTTSAPAPYTRARRGVYPAAVRSRNDRALHRRR